MLTTIRCTTRRFKKWFVALTVALAVFASLVLARASERCQHLGRMMYLVECPANLGSVHHQVGKEKDHVRDQQPNGSLTTVGVPVACHRFTGQLDSFKVLFFPKDD